MSGASLPLVAVVAGGQREGFGNIHQRFPRRRFGVCSIGCCIQLLMLQVCPDRACPYLFVVLWSHVCTPNSNLLNSIKAGSRAGQVRPILLNVDMKALEPRHFQECSLAEFRLFVSKILFVLISATSNSATQSERAVRSFVRETTFGCAVRILCNLMT